MAARGGSTTRPIRRDGLEARDGGDADGGWENWEGRQAGFQNLCPGSDSDSPS